MNTTASPKRPVGSEVGIDSPNFPGVWIVESNGPVNATLTRKGGGRKVRCPHYALTDPPVEGGVPGSTVQAIPVEDKRIYSLGEFVRINDGKYAGLWVVVKDDGRDKVNLAKPGGDGDRYLRAARRGLTPVPAADVLK